MAKSVSIFITLIIILATFDCLTALSVVWLPTTVKGLLMEEVRVRPSSGMWTEAVLS